jgi:protein-S-isoprenylcysteine O-methyltransferase Ste14
MNYALFTVTLISFMLYLRASTAFITNDPASEKLYKIIVVCTVLSAIVHLWLLWRTPVISHKNANLASLCYIAGLSIFIAARKATSVHRRTLSFTPDMPFWLLNKGIYSVIRHPFFLAFFLTWLGGVLEVGCKRTTVSTVIMVLLYWTAARRQERQYENSMLGAEYRFYKSRTGMFLPSIRLFR